jgi:hypothetical protein
LEPFQQIKTVARLQKLLSAPTSVSAEQVSKAFGIMKKQALVPLSEQIENWDEVVAWGYGGDVDEWEDLFR